ncbi:acyl carrier protein [Bombilactobacillus folatiphilus]|uniref:Acyl carrier protein n=1 Tax=Bombilactobacillus folatiphilus TaxID=2923362 RepID=A0ABY4P7M0_9LACO|nr:acyl carrier protein [Bombilactobacillus folatiphilus]UQS81607.1 acyl carrier protein [Bombilactobacillus folatiphilus]
MTRQEIFDKISKMLSVRFDVAVDQIKDETSFQNDLHADSIDMVEFELELEDDFGAEIPDEEAIKIQTVGAAVDYILSQQQ